MPPVPVPVHPKSGGNNPPKLVVVNCLLPQLSLHLPLGEVDHRGQPGEQLPEDDPEGVYVGLEADPVVVQDLRGRPGRRPEDAVSLRVGLVPGYLGALPEVGDLGLPLSV